MTSLCWGRALLLPPRGGPCQLRKAVPRQRQSLLPLSFPDLHLEANLRPPKTPRVRLGCFLQHAGIGVGNLTQARPSRMRYAGERERERDCVCVCARARACLCVCMSLSLSLPKPYTRNPTLGRKILMSVLLFKRPWVGHRHPREDRGQVRVQQLRVRVRRARANQPPDRGVRD